MKFLREPPPLFFLKTKGVFYQEGGAGRNFPDCFESPRCLFIDSESSVLDIIQCRQKCFYDAANFVYGKEDASNCYSRGKNIVGLVMIGNCQSFLF